MRPKQIHIVGCLPRSGTTLMTELMINCFNIDGYTEHECSIFKKYPSPYKILCTKRPNDIKRIKYPLKVNQDLFVIYMLRDPRDAISSRSHQNNRVDKKVWGSFDGWITHQKLADELESNSRFITVRYEDLVREPDKIQQDLLRQLPFLQIKAKFSEYHLVAKPSKKSAAALGEIRPINDSSVGSWRKFMPYIKAQTEKYRDINHFLTRLGYEENSSWSDEMRDVVADNSEEPPLTKSYLKELWDRYFKQPKRRLLYRLSCSKMTES